MNHSRVSTYVLGAILIVIGFGILFNNLNLFYFDVGSLIVPAVLTLIGVKLLDRGKRTAGGVVLGIGVLMLLGAFGINVGNLIGLAFSVAVIYFGYRMIRSKKKELAVPPVFERGDVNGASREGRGTSNGMRQEPHREEGEAAEGFTEDEMSRDREMPDGEKNTSYRAEQEASGRSYRNEAPKVKHSLIGNLYLSAPRWELTDMNIWHGFGDVKIDLSRALIHETETVVIINGWIGDIDIYVPYDLEIALTAHVNIGDVDIFGNKEGGINRSVSIETPHYRIASKRVRFVVSLLIGDVDVMYV